MATNKEIHDFAERYFDRYLSTQTKEHEVEEEFADECFSLGFKMDCGNAFEAAYPNSGAFNDAGALVSMINEVEDIMLLGSAIFSKWRYITHWSYGESLLSHENRAWFLAAFSRLAELASEAESKPFVFEGKAGKIEITSNNISYGPCPLPEDEVEQYLAISADGSVWFCGYNFGEGGNYVLGRTRHFNIGGQRAARILDTVAVYFSGDFEEVWATDIGSWEMMLTNDIGKGFKFWGSLCADFNVNGTDLSDLIRRVLEMPDLFVFDGNATTDCVERMEIDYRRVAEARPKDPFCRSGDSGICEYAERLVIDRKTETMEHVMKMGRGYEVTRKYHVEEGVSLLLDQLDAEDLFADIPGNPADAAGDPEAARVYEITVEFQKRSKLVIKGTYDKQGLPSDWPEVAESIQSFLHFYGTGEILNPAVYRKEKRRENDRIFLDVEYDKGGKTYCYLTDDDGIQIGDEVLVPVGNEGRITVAEVVGIHYLPEEKAPYPMDKMKKVLSKYTDDDDSNIFRDIIEPR